MTPSFKKNNFSVWPQVDAEPYVEMCVEAACSCPSVGDCACFCDVIAAYAQACSEKGVSISWRSNELCREFLQISWYRSQICSIIIKIFIIPLKILQL